MPFPCYPCLKGGKWHQLPLSFPRLPGIIPAAASHIHFRIFELRPGSPFFQRYGVNLPSSLTEVRSFTLGVLPLPTGVGVRYGQSVVSREAFLDGLATPDFRPLAKARAPGQSCCVGD